MNFILVVAYWLTYILHHRQKPGLLRICKAETLNLSFINPVSLTLLRMVQDVSYLNRDVIAVRVVEFPFINPALINPTKDKNGHNAAKNSRRAIELIFDDLTFGFSIFIC